MPHAEQDISALRDMIAGPGMDTRQWFAMGTVDKDTGGGHSVNFNGEDGSPLPLGVIVNVTLWTSGISIPCRVLMPAAGSGEAEYSPIGPGDEVAIAIPDGNERSGGIILGKLANSLDTFPATVAGMDVTNNSVSFKRIKTPYVLETAASYMVRQSSTGAAFSIDPTGNLILADGEGATLAMNADVLSWATSDGQASIQIEPGSHDVAIQAGGTSMVFDGTSSTFNTAGTLAIGTAGFNAGQHAISLEQVLSLISNVICGLAAAQAFNPASPTFGSTFMLPPPTGTAIAALTTLFSLAIPGCTTPVPIGQSGAPGGILDELALAPLIAAALAIPTLFGPDIGPSPAPFEPGLARGALMI